MQCWRWNQGLMHARQGLYRWTSSVALRSYLISNTTTSFYTNLKPSHFFKHNILISRSSKRMFYSSRVSKIHFEHRPPPPRLHDRIFPTAACLAECYCIGTLSTHKGRSDLPDLSNSLSPAAFRSIFFPVIVLPLQILGVRIRRAGNEMHGGRAWRPTMFARELSALGPGFLLAVHWGGWGWGGGCHFRSSTGPRAHFLSQLRTFQGKKTPALTLLA